MADMRYFADLPNGETLEFRKVDYRSRKDIRGYDAVAGVWVACNRVVEYRMNASRHECDDRCMNATGRVMKCECACGGRNHGKGSGLRQTSSASAF